MNVGAGNVISDSAQINPGVIVNADINASAGIVHSKLSGVAKNGANDDITSLSALSTPLSVEQGGTERASLDANRLLVGAGTAAPVSIAVGTSGQFLKSNGAGSDPSWDTVAAVTAIKLGATTKNANDASGQQTIAHGCGATPKYIRLSFAKQSGTLTTGVGAVLVYDGTTRTGLGSWNINSAVATAVVAGKIRIFMASSGSYSEGTVTMDGTNIIIDWVRTGADSSHTYDILWEAYV